MEALQEKAAGRDRASPYFASRKPIALDVEERKVVYLNIDTKPGEQSGAFDGEAVTLPAALVPPGE